MRLMSAGPAENHCARICPAGSSPGPWLVPAPLSHREQGRPLTYFIPMSVLIRRKITINSTWVSGCFLFLLLFFFNVRII